MSGLVKRLAAYLELVKFAHTVFALPFAFLAAFLAARGWPPLRESLLILLAMVGARTGAMALNRVLDRAHDARNPRTRSRPLVTGQVTTRAAVVLVVLSYALLVAAAWALNPLALKLSPVAIVILSGYSLTKRFSWLSHAVLGLALAGAPLGAWIAITGRLAWAPVVLGLAVILWVAGFDIIYACQDVDFDRREGLKSIPARFGVERALHISTALHVTMLACLLALPLLAPLGALFVTGVVVVGALLVYEHRLVGPRSLASVNEAFFTMNGLVSIALLLFGAADVLLFSVG